MHFTQAETNENYIYREVSENGTVELGVYPVAFGFRIRAGFVGDGWVNMDWCAGDQQHVIEWLFSCAKTILSKRKDNMEAFQGIPECCLIKPFFNDQDFVWEISNLAEEVVNYKLPDLHDLKNKYINDVFKETKTILDNK